jgi:Fe-S oxidoreductase
MEQFGVPSREVFRHLSAPWIAAFYLFALVAMAVFLHGCRMRVRKFLAGRPVALAGSWQVCIARALKNIVSHSSLFRRDRKAGAAHALVFYGFLALFCGTLLIMLDHDVLGLWAPQLRFWRGSFYLGYSLALDVMAGALLVGLALLAWRRWGARLPQLDYGHRPATISAYIHDDRFFVGGLLLLAATGLALEGLRICADRPAWEVWSVLGWRIANLYDVLGMSRATASALHPYLWFFHGLLALAFIAYVPYSKAVHMLAGPANLVLQDPLAGKRLAPIDPELEGAGYRRIADLTRKDLLALDACTKCGRCHVSCPAQAGGWPLSPRDLILDLREAAECALGGKSWYNLRRPAPAAGASASLVDPRAVWACTTCRACVDVCPVGIEHVPIIVELRRAMVDDGFVSPPLQAVLERIGRFGNSFGEPVSARGRWTTGLPFRIKDARREPVDYLWFVGDYASYDPGAQAVTRAAARLLHAAGVDFGILYEDEWTAGNDIRRIGEEGLYQLVAEKNLQAMTAARFRAIVTTDPHSYNTLAFEYGTLGAEPRILTVRHIAEVIDEAVQARQLRVRIPNNAIATYHDPCHLSRYANVTAAPRAVIRAVGLTLVEMERHGAASFCCGAGGGRIWMTDQGDAERPAIQRMREALKIPGLRYFVVACPKDLSMFRDAAKALVPDGSVQVRDLIELLDEAVGETA